MTVSSESNLVIYVRTGTLTEYTYTYRADADEDIQVYVNDIRLLSGYTLSRNPDNVGGVVSMDSVGASGDLLAILRHLEVTQEIDYTPYDAFPAETHERGLDKLTMIAQQLGADTARNVRMPESEDPGRINVVLPPVVDRAEKYMFFDGEGSVTAVEAELAAPSVFRVDIQDGTGGEDSRDMLHSETISGGANYPKIGVKNVNKANGLLQLTDQGNIPPGLMNIVGIQIRGPFRGDDLCDKLGDDPGECLIPDTRNPSERFLDLADSFTTGDTFIITMADGETSGTMNLFLYVGQATPSIVSVNPRDGVIYAEEIRHPDTDAILTYEGWYLFPKLVETGDASFISYNPAGNEYLTGNNVQVALDQTDDHFIDIDNWFMTQRVNTREAILHSDADAILAGGHYRLPPGSAGLPNITSEFYIVQMQGSGANLTQIATDRSNGAVWGRGMVDGAWRPWRQAGGDIPSGSVMLFYQAEAPEGWTKIAAVEGATVRLVNGNGGGSGGVHEIDNPPSLTHSHTGGNHNHRILGSTATAGTTSGGYAVAGGAQGHRHAIDFTSGSSGIGETGNRTPTSFAPLYIDCILCSKN